MKFFLTLALLISLAVTSQAASTSAPAAQYSCKNSQGETATFLTADCTKAAGKILSGASEAKCGTCALMVFNPKDKKPVSLPSQDRVPDVIHATVVKLLSHCNDAPSTAQSQKTRRAANGSSQNVDAVLLLGKGDNTKCA